MGLIYFYLSIFMVKRRGILRRMRNVNVKQSLTGLEWPRGFREVKVPRFHDNGTG